MEGISNCPSALDRWRLLQTKCPIQSAPLLALGRVQDSLGSQYTDTQGPAALLQGAFCEGEGQEEP